MATRPALSPTNRWGGLSTQCRRGDVALCEVAQARCTNPAHRKARVDADAVRMDEAPDLAGHVDLLDVTAVVARTAVRIWHSGVLKRDTSLGELANICVVPLEAVNEAEADWHRHNGGEPRRTKKSLAPGQEGFKRCSRCDTWKPPDAFNVANRRTGKLNGWCRACTSDYQKARYIAAREMGLLTAVRQLLEEGSPFVGSPCACCGAPLIVGDTVEIADVELRHADCEVTELDVP